MPIRIADRYLGPGLPLFAIAEIGLNHGGSLSDALALVDAAGRSGASAVKLQTLRADRLVAAHCPPPAHVQVASLRDFFRQFELDEDAHRQVAERAHALGLAFMSTPFDLDAVDMLTRVGVDAFKIASGDLTFVSLIRRAAATGKPLVISSGMSSLDEVIAAVGWARQAGATEIAVLHCVSSYPTLSDDENLSAIRTLSETLGVPVGLSDHGTTPEASAIAVALGGCLYERHLVGGPGSDAIDRAVSSTPEELADALARAERTRRALGTGRKVCQPAEAANRHGSRRGIYAARAIRRGQIIREDDLAALRPADGIPAEAVDAVVGFVAARDIAEEASIGWGDLGPAEEWRPARAV